MSIHHHPDDEFLMAYAAGSLPEAWSLLIATHAALCPQCRSEVGAGEAVGGSLLDDEAAVPMFDSALEATLARIDAPGDSGPAPEAAAAAGNPVLPQPLRAYAGSDLAGLRWRPLGRGAQHIPLVRGPNGVSARLLKVPAGKPVPEHGHNGLELTMVLSGSFVDGGQRFGPGDVETADETLEHRPEAEPGVDCVCLAVTDAPLRFRGVVARLVQPLIGI